jgi:hypothetical protein
MGQNASMLGESNVAGPLGHGQLAMDFVHRDTLKLNFANYFLELLLETF